MLGTCAPLPGASVFISSDEHGERPVAGYSTVTDANGSYSLKVDGIPSYPRANDYYIVFAKAGYEQLVEEINPGPFSEKMMPNTVFLKSRDEVSDDMPRKGHRVPD